MSVMVTVSRSISVQDVPDLRSSETRRVPLLIPAKGLWTGSNHSLFSRSWPCQSPSQLDAVCGPSTAKMLPESFGPRITKRVVSVRGSDTLPCNWMGVPRIRAIERSTWLGETLRNDDVQTKGLATTVNGASTTHSPSRFRDVTRRR